MKRLASIEVLPCQQEGAGDASLMGLWFKANTLRGVSVARGRAVTADVTARDAALNVNTHDVSWTESLLVCTVYVCMYVCLSGRLSIFPISIRHPIDLKLLRS